MIASLINKIKKSFIGTVFEEDTLSKKRSLDYSDDDDDSVCSEPQQKRNRFSSYEINSFSDNRTYHIPSNILEISSHNRMSRMKDLKKHGASSHIPSPIFTSFKDIEFSKSTPLDKDLHLTPAFADFKFDPSAMSTIDKLGINISKRRALKPKETPSHHLLGFNSNRPRGSTEISRVTKKRRLVEFMRPLRNFCTPRESIRLDDKERYRQLIQQYTTAEITSRSSAFKRIKAIMPAPEFIDISREEVIGSGAIRKFRLDPISTSKTRLRLEKTEDFPLPSLALPSIPTAMGLASAKRKSLTYKTIPVIDLSLDDDSSAESSDDIFITKEIISKKPTRNTLEKRLQKSPFYSDEWLGDIKRFYKNKNQKFEEDIKDSNETIKIREESRRQECEKSLWNKVSKRIAALDMKYPDKVIEVSDEVEELPELTHEMEGVIDRAFRGGPPTHVLAEKFSLQITRRDIHTLGGLNWLNDEIINFYMNMLMERGKTNGYLSVYAFNTFFYSKLAKVGYGSIRRWTKKVDIFSYDLLLIPVHLGMHWCLAVIDFKSKVIKYYDSMSGNNHKCLTDLSHYLVSEHQDKKKSSFDALSLSSELVKDIPQQMNGSDCGMFSCKFAEYLSREAKISFTQEDMPYFRRRMVYEIVTQSLL